MSKYYVMVEDHRMAVASADTLEEINEIHEDLSQYEGYKDKMIVLEKITMKNKYGAPDNGYPALLESEIDGEE